MNDVPLQGDVLPPDVVLCWFDIFLPIYPEIHLHKVYSPLVLCIFQNCGDFFHPKLPIDKNDIPYVPRLSEKDKKEVFIYYCYNTYLIDLDKWASHTQARIS